MPADHPPDVDFYPLPAGTRLPFSEAVRVGSLLYLSGQMGTDASGRLVAGGIEAETRQILANVRAVLERHGSSMDRVVKCLVMLADMAEWPAMNTVYLEHFTLPLPARSAFGANGLALGGRIELECIAVVGER
jgi:2-iminobutanoate/2-iminopropanoate deaminase